MPSFLVTSQMSPELKLRVLRSVRGESILGSPRGIRPSARRLFRLLALLAICTLATSLTITYREQEAELRKTRQDLVERWSRYQVGLTASSRGKSGDLVALVETEARDYLGDQRDAELIGETPHRQLTRPAIYLRLALNDARAEAALMARSAESGRDALLGCFIKPPEVSDDKGIVDYVRRIYSPEFRSDLENYSPASRLFVAMTVMAPEFGAAIQRAPNVKELRRLDRAMDQAKLRETRPALDAELLVLVLDEEKRAGTATELDGASVHFVRLAVIDLISKAVLFRTRAEVSPLSVSEKYRSRSANSITGCRFGAQARSLWTGERTAESKDGTQGAQK